MTLGNYTGLWKLEEDRSKDYNTLEYWTDLAKILEEAKFHGIFLADVLGPYDVYGGPRNIVPAATSGAQYPLLDPLYVLLMDDDDKLVCLHPAAMNTDISTA